MTYQSSCAAANLTPWLRRMGRRALGIAMLAIPGAAAAQAWVPAASQGYRGWLDVPHAGVAAGQFSFGYSNEVSAHLGSKALEAQAYAVSFGLLPWVEIGGRLTGTHGPPGISDFRDLSPAIKLSLPPLHPWLPTLAIGTQDYIGNSNLFESRYLVASKALGPVDLSVGYGQDLDRLRGAFGSLALRLGDHVGLSAADDGAARKAGLVLRSPALAGVRFQTELLHQWPRDSSLTEDWAWTAAVTAPLGRDYPKARSLAQALRDGDTLALRPRAASAAVDLEALRSALRKAGFADARVAADVDELYAEFDAASYPANDLDAWGVALGVVARLAPCEARQATLALKRNGLRVAGARAALQTLRAALGGPSCPEDAGIAGSEAEGLRWLDGGSVNPPAFAQQVLDDWGGVTARTMLYPALDYFLGTEGGNFEGSVALAADTAISFWPGNAFNFALQGHVASSQDYERNGVFAARRARSGLRHALVHQALVPCGGCFALVSAGRLQFDYLGTLAEAAYRPVSRDVFAAMLAGHFEDGDDRRTLAVGTLGYQWSAPDARITLAYGRFWQQDTGYRLEITRYFSDTEVTLYGKYNGDTVAGLRFGIPLTPRRLTEGAWKLSGSERYSVDLEASANQGVLNRGVAQLPNRYYTLERIYLNGGRSGADYWDAGAGRMLDADRRYGSE